MSDGEITATLICPADMDRLILMFLSQQVLSLHGVIGRHPPPPHNKETQTWRQCLREKLILVWQLEVIRQRRPPLALGNQ